MSKHLATAGRKNSSLFKLPLYSLYKAYTVYTGFYIHHIMKLQIQVRAMAMKFSSLVGNPYNYGLPMLGLKHTHRTRVIYNNPNFSRRTFSLLINFFYTKTFNTSTAYVIISKIYWKINKYCTSCTCTWTSTHYYSAPRACDSLWDKWDSLNQNLLEDGDEAKTAKPVQLMIQGCYGEEAKA